MFNPSREQVRQFFCEAWRKHRERLPLQGAEAVAADLIVEHPEYHALLERPEVALEQEFTPEGGQSNPFLHLSLHLAVAEQVSIDQPRGIKQAYELLAARRGSRHDAQHEVMECLGQMMWESQRSGLPPDGDKYIDCVRRRATQD